MKFRKLVKDKNGREVTLILEYVDGRIVLDDVCAETQEAAESFSDDEIGVFVKDFAYDFQEFMCNTRSMVIK